MRLWLRSEQAFGLSAVVRARRPLRRRSAVAPAQLSSGASAQISPTRPARPVTSVVPAPSNSSKPTPPVSVPAPILASATLIPPRSNEAFSSPTLTSEEKRRRLTLIDESEVRGCTRCRLCEGRTQTVFGEGDPDASVFFIGEGPGECEDQQGRPFVGRAGEMLTKWIAGMGLRREQVYIANIVKCRPPGNRAPMPDEVTACTPFLERQLEIVRPGVIVTLGLPALKYMMNDPKLTMNRSRGTWRQWRGIKLMPTFHPAYLLRSYTDETRAAVWSDLKAVMAELGLPMPKRS